MARRPKELKDWCPIQKELVPEDDERDRLTRIVRDALLALPVPRSDYEARRQIAAVRMAVLATLGLEPILGMGGTGIF